MSKRAAPTDPYAPPPMYHDRSGRLVRIGLIAVLLAALGVGYFAWQAGSPREDAAFAPPAQQQQLAQNVYRAPPEQIPQAQPAAPTPQATSPAPAPVRHRAAPARPSRSSPVESTPPAAEAPTTPAPIPPATTAPQSPDTTPPAQG